MPDDRSLIEKLEAMASQTASPAEAEIAQAILQRLGREKDAALPGEKKNTRILTREAVSAQFDDILAGRACRLYIGGTIYLLNEEDIPWKLVKQYGYQVEYLS